jgi:hypothetical protein
MESPEAINLEIGELVRQLEGNVMSVRRLYQCNAIFYGFVASVFLRMAAHAVASSTKVGVLENLYLGAFAAVLTFTAIWFWLLHRFSRDHALSLATIQDAKKRLSA